MATRRSANPEGSSAEQADSVSRRKFHETALVAATGVTALHQSSPPAAAQDAADQKDALLGENIAGELVVIDDFQRADTFYHGDGWESLNPGYWKIEENALRRRVRTRGDRARKTGFPFHYETHNINNGVMPTEYLSSAPYSMLWRRDWNLSGGYMIVVEATVQELPKKTDGFSLNPGDSLIGICFGAKTRMESWYGGSRVGQACWYAAWRDNQTFGIYDHAKDLPTPAQKQSERPAAALKAGDPIIMYLKVNPTDAIKADVTAQFVFKDQVTTVQCQGVDQAAITSGYFGVVTRGLLDVEIRRVLLVAEDNEPIRSDINELRLAYPLGNTLKQNTDGKWTCRFITVFRDQGDKAEIRISSEEKPEKGWEAVPVAGSATIITNEFRRATAVVDVTLPANPGETEMFYTVWKDGVDVTADPRSGFLGQQNYVGRLPRLTAPYRLCGLSCHAIHGEFDGGRAGKFQENWIHDQPAVNAYKHLDEYDFQVMVWEDDIWYLELLLYTTSVDDAYLQIMTAIAGPTSRWQMMRHWNTLNPGDHDYGMDDVKGPEQLALRKHEDLGQDREYMRRNFQIVQHLISGDEKPSATENPKRWSAWEMPNGDFTLAIVDARLWRSSQDTHIWATEGWGDKENVYARTDPTRSLLGEEQFAWLQELITTSASPLIMTTGINGMHTIWEPSPMTQRNRVVADYAGWVKAGCDRVLELFGSRDGVFSVYGDVHNGCIMKNLEHNLYECCFGPIGRTGGRQLKPEFGPTMKDYDGRPLEITALYHKAFESPSKKPRTGPQYWNFMEMHFDPREDGNVQFKIRNLIDPPTDKPRGGGSATIPLQSTGRPIACQLPKIKTLPSADVRFATIQGQPIRGTRSTATGIISLKGLVDIEPETRVVMTAVAGTEIDAQVITTLPIAEG